MSTTSKTKTWQQVRGALETTMNRMGVTAYTVESPFEDARAIEKRKAGSKPQTIEQSSVTLEFNLSPIWFNSNHAKERHIRITARSRETAVENLDALQRAFETIRLTAVRNLDGIVYRVYRQMFPQQQSRSIPPQQEPPRTTPKSSGASAVLHIADEAPLAVAEAAYRALIRDVHPDVGGSHELAVALNAAIHTIRLQHEARRHA